MRSVFSGGFSVYAARGRRKHGHRSRHQRARTGIAKRNFALNKHFPGVAACHHKTVQADAFDWLAANPETFDLIVLDPPRLPSARRSAKARFAPTNG